MLRKFLTKKSRGFTLIELAIVVTIVGILAAISVPFYRSYVRNAYVGEGQALCNTVAAAEFVYRGENDTFILSGGGSVGTIPIDTSRNTYFTSFTVTAGGSGIATSFVITTTGVGSASGITITYNGYSNLPAVINITGT